MIAPGVLAGAFAFLTCVLLLPVVKIVSERYRLFDSPGPLKIHNRPISRLGGVAIAVSLSLGVLLCGLGNSVKTLTFFAALLLVWISGLADDLWGLTPVIRLAAQVAAGSILWFGGLRVPVLGGGFGSYVGICLIVVLFVNSFNFLDGADGVAAGIAAIIGVTYFLQFDGSPFSLSAAIACALAGACLGFLIANFPPASLFMGDSGSTAIGFVTAFLALNAYRAHESSPLAFNIALLPAGLPLLDAIVVVLRRVRRKVSPFYGDRVHFYDLLMARQWSARRVALVCYGITGIFCLAGWLAIRYTYPWGIGIPSIAVTGFLLLEWRLDSLQIPKRHNSIAETTAWRSANVVGDSK